MTSIVFKDVAKAYGDNPPVLREVNLNIRESEFCVFIGPSGCGKSTLLRMIAGLEEISEGEIHIGGRRMHDVAPAQRGIAMVFQSYALFPHMTVYENMAFGLQLAKVAKAEFRVTRGDVVLVVPAAAPVDGAMMLIQAPQGRVLRVIKRLDNFKVLLQRYDAACESEIMAVDELHIVGRCVRLEAEL